MSPPPTDHNFLWTLLVCIPVAVGITLWRNSDWELELRSLRALCHDGYDGYLSPLCLAAIYPGVKAGEWLGVRFDLWDPAYVVYAVWLTGLTFSAAFAVSAFRQSNPIAQICAGVTWLFFAGPLLLFSR